MNRFGARLLFILIMCVSINHSFAQQTSPTQQTLCFDNACVCSASRGLIICDGFYSFAELKFAQPPHFTVNYLLIKPQNKIPLDGDLDLTGLEFNQTFTTISLNNLNGFKYSANAFRSVLSAKSSKLVIENSNIFLYNDQKFNPNSVLASFDEIVFYTANKFTRSESILAPGWFSSSKNLSLVFYDLNSDSNIFSVDKTDSLYNSSITSLSFIECDLDRLNSDIVDRALFKNIQRLSILSSYLNSIEEKLLESFANLKLFELRLLNYEEFAENWTHKFDNISVEMAKSVAVESFDRDPRNKLKPLEMSSINLRDGTSSDHNSSNCSVRIQELENQHKQEFVILFVFIGVLGLVCLLLLISNIVFIVKYRILRKLRSEISYEVDYFHSNYMPKEEE
jgi:hypothetical protein